MAVPSLLVLGVAQDGGHPQPGCARPCCAGLPPALHRPACAAIWDPDTGERWLLDATPALPSQLASLDAAAPSSRPAPGLSGVLLTHAHMGHYTGLLFLGREVMSVRGLPLFVQPRMAAFLAGNAPWSQLVQLGNVALVVGEGVQLNPRLRATALAVPHRDEHSETVAWRIEGPSRSVLWLPDIDAWDGWPLEEVLATVDVAFLDGTFWADGELSRDMTEIPHPRVVDTLARLAALPAAAREKVHFIHLNHTNPALRPDSPEARAIQQAGARIAWEGQQVRL